MAMTTQLEPPLEPPRRRQHAARSYVAPAPRQRQSTRYASPDDQHDTRRLVEDGITDANPEAGSAMRPPRSAAYASLLIMTAAVLAACSVSSVNGSPSPAPSVSATGGSVSLSGWQLTLPMAGKHGTAAINPAAASPPWLSTDDSGGLVLFAPIDGAKTKNSDHARTELVDLNTFTAGSGRHTLRASIAVSQVAAASRPPRGR